MSEPDSPKHTTIAAVIAIPVMIACCAAPVFTFGLISAGIGWFSGIGSMEMIGLFGVVAAIAFGFNRFKGIKTKA